MMSKLKKSNTHKLELTGNPPVRVKVHNSPPQSTPRDIPTSPGMIPAFELKDSITAATDIYRTDNTSKRKRDTVSRTKPLYHKTVIKEKIKTKPDEKKQSKIVNTRTKLKLDKQTSQVPPSINKRRDVKIGKSYTEPNLAPQLPKDERRVFSARELNDEKDIDEFLKTFLKYDFPPYNPDEFTPKDDSSVSNEATLPNDQEELLKNIRQELEEWMTTKPKEKQKKYSCPEKWKSVPQTCEKGRTSEGEVKRTAEKENVHKENVAVQTAPTRNKDQNIINFSFLNRPDIMSVDEPKSPPLPKSKVLDVTNQLLSVAERKLISAEAKLSNHLLSDRTSSRNTSQPPSARRIMTNVPITPTKRSAYNNSAHTDKSETSNKAHQNTASLVKGPKNREKYEMKNGEKKRVKLNNFANKDSKSLRSQSEKNKEEINQTNIDSLSKSSGVTELSMFYEQQQLVERKTQSVKEKSSATVIFTSGTKVISSHDVIKHDVQTNTEPDINNVPLKNVKIPQNSSMIQMTTSKPEVEEEAIGSDSKTLRIQKMPSVNIRPGFTIQHGPKINISSSGSNFFKSKRKNTEYFDVVYPPISPVSSESSLLLDSGRQVKVKDNHVEYVCERHIFPSGKLIPGTLGDNLRLNLKQNTLTLDEKKNLLVDLITSLTNKVEKQVPKEKSCCRLSVSLPLLASVVNKIQVNCVKCIDVLHSHLDRIIILMKEELRSHKNISESHCCQLDETVHYQIVELELLQEENLKRETTEAITVKHKDGVNGKFALW